MSINSASSDVVSYTRQSVGEPSPPLDTTQTLSADSSTSTLEERVPQLHAVSSTDVVKVKKLVHTVWGKLRARNKRSYKLKVGANSVSIPYPQRSDRCDNDIRKNIHDLEEQFVLLHNILNLDEINTSMVPILFNREFSIEHLKCNHAYTNIMYDRVYCTWLVIKVIDLQAMLHSEGMECDKINIDNDSIMITINEEDINTAPLFYPRESDFKIINKFDDRLVIAIRNYLFVKSDSKTKISIAGSLEQQEFTNFMLDPHQFFCDLLRYMQFTAFEFIDLIFHRDLEGKKRRVTCLCGNVTSSTPRGILIKNHDCNVLKFIKRYLSHIIDNGFIVTNSGTVLNQKDSDYIRDILRSRLPVKVTVLEHGIIKLIRKESGKDDRVISVTKIATVPK